MKTYRKLINDALDVKSFGSELAEAVGYGKGRRNKHMGSHRCVIVAVVVDLLIAGDIVSPIKLKELLATSDYVWVHSYKSVITDDGMAKCAFEVIMDDLKQEGFFKIQRNLKTSDLCPDGVGYVPTEALFNKMEESEKNNIKKYSVPQTQDFQLRSNQQIAKSTARLEKIYKLREALRKAKEARKNVA